MARTDQMSTGNTAEIHRVGDSIVKVYTSADLAMVELEANKQRAAHALGFPVPAVIQVTEVDGKPALMMEYVPGTTMLEKIGDDWDLLPGYLARSVEIQRAMHAVTATGLPSMRSKLEHQIHQADMVPQARKNELIAGLDHLGPEAAVCHGDFHLQNLLVCGDHVTIIDWMDATAGNPVLDVCRSYVLYGSVSDVAADMYLLEYCSQSGLSADEVLRWQPVIAAARLSETLASNELERLANIVLSL